MRGKIRPKNAAPTKRRKSAVPTSQTPRYASADSRSCPDKAAIMNTQNSIAIIHASFPRDGIRIMSYARQVLNRRTRR